MTRRSRTQHILVFDSFACMQKNTFSCLLKGIVATLLSYRLERVLPQPLQSEETEDQGLVPFSSQPLIEERYALRTEE